MSRLQQIKNEKIIIVDQLTHRWHIISERRYNIPP
jgi:hypothetical protein